MFTPSSPTTTASSAIPLPGLAGEIGKRTPFDLPEQEAYLNLLRTTNQLSVHVAHLLRSFGLSEAGYNILRILRGSRMAAAAGHAEYEGRTCTAIGHEMVAQVPDVTRLVDRLEQQGLATRHRCAKDRRVVYVKITSKGLEVLSALDQPVLELHKATLGHLSADELRTLSDLLTKARRPPAR